ncbi:MAG: sodium ion-translocating decarboxylase subunit beta, partial [Aristaeellaceae bacterium]
MYRHSKMSRMRGFACLLILFVLLTAWAFAETSDVDASATNYVVREQIDQEAVDADVAAAKEAQADPEINIIQGLKKIVQSTGFAQGEWRQYVMIAVACLLLYLAIVKQFEPLLLLPIAFGMLLANLPAAGMMNHVSYTYYETLHEAAVAAEALGKDAQDIVWRYNEAAGMMQYSIQTSNAGLLYYLYQGVKLGIFPPIIFMGVGAMTDFGPLIANPKSLLLGAAAQLGIFITFIGAKLLGFSAAEAGSIGIIGGADGPTAIFVTTKL